MEALRKITHPNAFSLNLFMEISEIRCPSQFLKGITYYLFNFTSNVYGCVKHYLESSIFVDVFYYTKSSYTKVLQVALSGD
jgi:hypothetical protein